jgi:hypothetical protein
MIFNVVLHAVYACSDGAIVLIQLDLFLLVLIKFLLEVVVGGHVVADFLLEGDDVGFVLDDFLLRVLHGFVAVYLLVYLFYVRLDRHAILLHELQPVVDEFVFSLLETRDVGLDVPVVEVGVAGQHRLDYYNIFINDFYRQRQNLYARFRWED